MFNPPRSRKSSGLSPRLRGNRRRGYRGRAGLGSIPAPAGEPLTTPPTRCATGVYPRACGGTGTPVSGCFPHGGLSPRLRGNLRRALHPVLPDGSIPAPAGEPHRVGNIKRNGEAYPRACGGTIWSIAIDSPAMGLSPAPCGGTKELWPDSLGDVGLSPRLRGNHGQRRRREGHHRSIPAPAGEPAFRAAAFLASSVYPRACGGTKG